MEVLCVSSSTSCGNRKEYEKSSRHQQLHCLLVWGCGEFGQHGHNHNNDVTLEESLKQVREGRLVIAGHSPAVIASGSSHTLVLTDNDILFSWGNGTSGQLGNSTCKTSHKPMQVSLMLKTKIQGMACGARHSFFWTKDGQCYSFGNNFNAQLGYNFTKPDFKDNQLKPILVEFFPGLMVKEVACGARHTVFLLTTGLVMAVGCNQQGQIGNGSTEDVAIPIRLEDLTSISHIACGNSHSLAASETGQLYAWGYGKAFGTKARYIASPHMFIQNCNCPVASMAAGDSHSMALYENGNLYTWGNNYEGQLGLGQSTKYQSEPKEIPDEILPRPIMQISCGETTCAAVTGEGKLYMWGKNAGLIHPEKPSQYFQFEPYLTETEGRLVKQVSCGAWHVAAIIENISEAHIINESEESSNINEVVLETVLSGHQDVGSDNKDSIQTVVKENIFIDKDTSPWVTCDKDILEDNQYIDGTINYSEEITFSDKIENLGEQQCANKRTTSTIKKSIVHGYTEYAIPTETNLPVNEENCSNFTNDCSSLSTLDTTQTRLGKVDKETMKNSTFKRQNYQMNIKRKLAPSEAAETSTPSVTGTGKKSSLDDNWNASLQPASNVSEYYSYSKDICQERTEKNPQFSELSNGDEFSKIMEKDVDTILFYNKE